MLRQENKRQKDILTFLIMAFIILQPFLDCKLLFVDERFQIAGFTIPTLVRFGGIFIMALLSLRNITDKKTLLKYVVYGAFVFAYFVGHHLVVSKELAVPDSYGYSAFSELLYVVRMVLPFVILYLIREVKITYKRFILCLQIVSITIGAVIIVSNLFHISLTSYYAPSKHNVLNFIEWFTHDLTQYKFEELTSKGWFFMANQISSLMLLLLPINLYDMLKRTSKLSVVSTFLLAVSMILLGTRIAVYGTLGMLLVYVVLFLFFKLLKKEELKWKASIPLVALICIIGVLFVYSPIERRVYTYGEVDTEEIDSIMGNEDYEDLDETQIAANILKVYRDFKISDIYIFKIYPYTEDVMFWKEFLEDYQGQVQNNRDMQNLITNRISELNDEAKYKLFGYSYNRFTNGGLYLEQDIVVHYYTLGILGVIILLGPWFACLIRLLFVMFLGKNRRFNFLNCTLAGAITACIGASVFSGHVLDELIVTLFLGFVAGFAMFNCDETGTEQEKII